MKANNKEFSAFLITMVVGGLVYSIASFAYMHTTFVVKEKVIDQDMRISRVEHRTDERLKSIEDKVDRLLRKAR